MTTRIARITTALAAGAALATALAPGVAAAKPAHVGASTKTGIHTAAPTRTTARTTVNTRLGPISTTTNVHVEAGPTGDGPADEDVCNSFAANINQQLANLQLDMDYGDADGAVSQVDAIDNLTNMATDAGCFIVDD